MAVASPSDARSAGLSGAIARTAPASLASAAGRRFKAASISDSKRTRVALSSSSARAAGRRPDDSGPDFPSALARGAASVYVPGPTRRAVDSARSRFTFATCSPPSASEPLALWTISEAERVSAPNH